MKVSDDLPALSAETKGSGDKGPTKTRWDLDLAVRSGKLD